METAVFKSKVSVNLKNVIKKKKFLLWKLNDTSET